jgi:hypothetical protein
LSFPDVTEEEGFSQPGVDHADHEQQGTGNA